MYKTYEFTLTTTGGYNYADKIQGYSVRDAWTQLLENLSQSQLEDLAGINFKAVTPVKINTLPGYSEVDDRYVYDYESHRIINTSSKKHLHAYDSCNVNMEFDPTYRVVLVKKNGKQSSYKFDNIIELIGEYLDYDYDSLY